MVPGKQLFVNIIPPLHPDHLDDLKKSGLSNETICMSGIRTVPPRDISKRLGGNRSVLNTYEIPYPGLDFARYRCFYEEDKRNLPKYLQRKGTPNHLYIPPQIDAGALADASQPIYLTEGEKKSLKAAQEGLLCVALGGLWNWRQDKKLINDFDRLELNGREVMIVPDNDWKSKNRHGYDKNLIQAVHQLAGALTQRGAKVFVVELPQSDQKIGLDDYLIHHTVDEFLSLERRPITGKEGPKFTRKELSHRIEDEEDFEALTGPIAKDVFKSGLPETHIESLLKFIAKKTKVSVASLKADFKDVERVKADKNFMHLEAAAETVKSFGAGNLIESGNVTYLWTGSGVWRPIDPRGLKQRIHEIAGSEELTRNIVDSIADMVRTEVFKPNHRFDEDRRSI